jgi:hypothetical protein
MRCAAGRKMSHWQTSRRVKSAFSKKLVARYRRPWWGSAGECGGAADAGLPGLQGPLAEMQCDVGASPAS